MFPTLKIGKGTCAFFHSSMFVCLFVLGKVVSLSALVPLFFPYNPTAYQLAGLKQATLSLAVLGALPIKNVKWDMCVHSSIGPFPGALAPLLALFCSKL